MDTQNNKNPFLTDPLLIIEVMRNLTEGIFLIRLSDGIIVATNERFEKMFGYEPGEMIGKNVAIVNAPTDKSPEETRDSIMNTIKEKGEWHGKVENVKKDGTHFWCHADVSVFEYSDFGKVLLSVHTDIIDRKKAK